MADNMHILEINKNEIPVGINALVIKDNKILLGLRIGNRGGSGNWGLVGGKAICGESIEETMQRELKEEANLDVKLEDMKVVNLFTTQSSESILFYQIGVLILNYSGELKNMEPQKCGELKFFDLDALPENLFLGTKGNIELFKKKEFYNSNVNFDYRNK